MKVINVAGPPASSKTLHISRLTDEYSQFIHYPIDDFRIKYVDEMDAWYQFMVAIVNSPGIPIIESSGLSWKLHAHILNHPKIKEVKTIFFAGDREVFLKRLKTRTKPEVPFSYDLNEADLVDICLEKVPKKYKNYDILHTDGRNTIEEEYKQFREIILKDTRRKNNE